MPVFPYRETKKPIRARNLPGSVPSRPMSESDGEPTVRRMSLTASLDEASVTAAPGEETALPLRILNSGSTVEEYRFEVVGACAAWSAVELTTLSLYPGDSQTVSFILRPPRDSTVLAGEAPSGSGWCPPASRVTRWCPKGG